MTEAKTFNTSNNQKRNPQRRLTDFQTEQTSFFAVSSDNQQIAFSRVLAPAPETGARASCPPVWGATHAGWKARGPTGGGFVLTGVPKTVYKTTFLFANVFTNKTLDSIRDGMI